MKSLWDDREATQYTDDLGRRVYASRLLGREESLLPYTSVTSVKLGRRDVFGDQEEVLYLNDAKQDQEGIAAEGFVGMRLQRLVRLAGLESLSDSELITEIMSSALDPSAPVCSIDALVHAVLPHKYVDYAQADAILVIGNTPGGRARFQELYGDTVVIVPYVGAGLPLARACAKALSSGLGENTIGMVLVGNGLLSFGETAQASYARMVDLVTRAERYLSEREVWPVVVPDLLVPDRALRGELAALRQAVSAHAGFPVILTTHSDPLSLTFARRDDLVRLSQQGPAAPPHAIRTKAWPLLGRDVGAFQEAYERSVTAYALDAERMLATLDTAPRVILDPEFGMCAIGRTAPEADAVADVYRRTMETILAAAELEAYAPLPLKDAFEAEHSAAQRAILCPEGKSPIFAGEIAMVTGAASGIGKACAAAFLARGAAVVGLDIDPGIAKTFEGPGYLGIQCDVTDETSLLQALEATARTFGGLDMLVPNAGVFPPGRRIDVLTSPEWDRVMQVNLDANLTLMREAYPLLVASPRGGRVVVMGSRNVPAPGPGAVAYSASKAALVQMARVAALEWGKDGIRVNIVNPHAVFDTGIWTDEVLRARADYYGLTVEQYKKNNVLQVEITSHDVAALVAEMCGPLFAKTTGAQVPIDGGSNRVI